MRQPLPQQQTRHSSRPVVATRAAAEEGARRQSMEELFAAEVASRQAAETQAAEAAVASSFDGPALLALLRCVRACARA
jgi:hypothetical protein